MTRATPIAVDLFCGVGGMALGFEQAGFRVAASVDISEKSIETHRLNFPRTSAICADIEALNGAMLRRYGGLAREPIAVVFGGPPCQGFSIGGARDETDVRNALVLEFARLVVDLRPEYFVMENVGGLLLPQNAPLHRQFLRVLGNGGFEVVAPVCKLNAADFGVPQRRRRAFILGQRRGNPVPEYPVKPAEPRTVTVGEAIDDLLGVERRRLVDGGTYAGVLRRPSAYAARLRELPVDPKRKANLATGLTGFARTLHSVETVRRFRGVRPGGRDPISRFIRLDRNGVAPTLRAGTGLDEGRFMAPRPIHHEFDRVICTREAARLHSFPDWFVFHETKWHGFMQIGNSVPPLLAHAVASEVMRALRRA